MKSIHCKIDKLSVFLILATVLGVLSSYFDFGILSVFFSVTMPLIFIVNWVLTLYGIFKKRYFYAIGSIIYLVFYTSFFQFSKTNDLDSKDSISILTYNIRGFKQTIFANSKQKASTEIIKFIDSLSPDILVFQEYGYKEGKELKGYPYVFLGYRPGIHKSLLMIHSRYPIINKGYIDFPETKNNAIYADIVIKSDTIRVYNLHLQSYIIKPQITVQKNNDFNYWHSLNTTISKQIEQAKLIKNHASKSNERIFICGDFNATPYSQTYRLLRKGLSDSYVIHGNGLGTTYSHLKYPLRLDYVLFNEKIKVIKHKNFNLELSDHEPVYIQFKIKK